MKENVKFVEIMDFISVIFCIGDQDKSLSLYFINLQPKETISNQTQTTY